MASNFKIVRIEGEDSVILHLRGCFDGSAAHQLAETLKQQYQQASKIIVHTSLLERFSPFGQSVLRHNLGQLRRKRACFVFTGKYAPCLMEAWH